MRLVLLLTPLLCLSACGTVCDAAVAAENAANQRGEPCGSNSKVTVHDANKCNSGLSKCSPDDTKAIQSYIDCLNNLPQCTTDTQTSWNFSALGCELQPVGKISGTCSSAIF
jgi:hypothetical protein